MVLWIFLGLVALWMVYSGGPTIYYKYIHKQPYRPGHLELTFDDGPNPDTTPSFLDTLKAEDYHATFFLVGKKVLLQPDLARRIQAEGHAIGLHCYEHGQPALWTPKKTRTDMEKARQSLTQVGLRPRYYRPPHGWVNLTMLKLCKEWGLELKLWTLLPGDWEETKPWQETWQALIQADQAGGGVVCIHDSNDHLESKSRAPYHTLMALKAYFHWKNPGHGGGGEDSAATADASADVAGLAAATVPTASTAPAGVGAPADAKDQAAPRAESPAEEGTSAAQTGTNIIDLNRFREKKQGARDEDRGEKRQDRA